MQIAYADPPYLGQGYRYAKHHKAAKEWDVLSRHAELVADLVTFSDGWALSCSSSSLQALLRLPEMPTDVRISAWVKPFAVFKPGVNPAYAWEPVIWRGGRTKRNRTEPTVRDWVSVNITLKKGLSGAKPIQFADWLFDLMGLQVEDDLIDLFPGTGVIGDRWAERRKALSADPR